MEVTENFLRNYLLFIKDVLQYNQEMEIIPNLKKGGKTMAKSNIRLLTKDELKFFKENYSFIIKEDVILVKFKGYDRIVAHPIDSDFSIASKVRKIKISKEAISLWKDKFKATEYTVIDIQNAMNALTIGYQATDYNDVKNQLEIIKSKYEKDVF